MAMFNEIHMQDIVSMLDQLTGVKDTLNNLDAADLSARMGMFAIINRIYAKTYDAPTAMATEYKKLADELLKDTVNEMVFQYPDACIARCDQCNEGRDATNKDAHIWAYKHSQESGHTVTLYNISKVKVRETAHG